MKVIAEGFGFPHKLQLFPHNVISNEDAWVKLGFFVVAICVLDKGFKIEFCILYELLRSFHFPTSYIFLDSSCTASDWNWLGMESKVK